MNPSHKTVGGRGRGRWMMMMINMRSCAFSAVGARAHYSQHKTKDLYSFVHFYRDKQRFKRSKKRIKVGLKSFTYKLDNDGRSK